MSTYLDGTYLSIIIVAKAIEKLPFNRYYTKVDADARFQQMHADGASIVFKNGQIPYLYCSTSGLFYPILITIVDEVAILALGAGETL